jgi:hypothetical protein
MEANPTTPAYAVASDEKVIPVMVYTLTSVIRGDIVIKQTIRVSTWLRSAGSADYLFLHDAQVLFLGAGGHNIHTALAEFLVPSQQILALHVLPPTQEALDYDVSEPNRKIAPTSVFFGSFQIQCNLRMATTTNLATFLSTAKESFLTLYDGEITNQAIPNMNKIRAPMLYVRPGVVCFSQNLRK